MEKLNELDTEGVEPTSHVLPLRNVMREDEPRPSWPIEKVMLNAPDEEDGNFKYRQSWNSEGGTARVPT